jgi:hypothetical protein
VLRAIAVTTKHIAVRYIERESSGVRARLSAGATGPVQWNPGSTGPEAATRRGSAAAAHARGWRRARPTVSLVALLLRGLVERAWARQVGLPLCSVVAPAFGSSLPGHPESARARWTPRSATRSRACAGRAGPRARARLAAVRVGVGVRGCHAPMTAAHAAGVDVRKRAQRRGITQRTCQTAGP